MRSSSGGGTFASAGGATQPNNNSNAEKRITGHVSEKNINISPGKTGDQADRIVIGSRETAGKKIERLATIDTGCRYGKPRHCRGQLLIDTASQRRIDPS
jgi:hypothetical protein